MNDPDGLALMLIFALGGIVFILVCMAVERRLSKYQHTQMIERYQAQMRREIWQ